MWGIFTSKLSNMDKNNFSLTEAASKRIAFLLGKREPQVKLRISIEGGGCSGFQYRYNFPFE